MDLNALYESLASQLGETLPSIGGALLILIGGWFAAVIIRAVMRRALHGVGTNERLETSTGSPIDVEGGASSVAYYVVLAVVLVAFFNALDLQQVSGTMQGLVNQMLGFAPKLIAGGVLMLVAWILATIVRSVATRGLAATTIDERLSGAADMRPMSDSLGTVPYWLVILLFLPGVLDVLEMKGLLEPVQGMVDQILSMLPGVLGAAVIGTVGWFVARMLRDLVASLLAAAGADRLGERAGLQGNTTLSKLVGIVVYVFVFVPALIAALNALAIEAISKPATEMLSAFLAAIPNVFGAGLILAVAYFVSKLIFELATGLLEGAGFDQLPTKLGIGDVLPQDNAPSAMVGKLLVFFIMLFAAVEAASRLGFAQVSGIVTMLIAFGLTLGAVTVAVALSFDLNGREAAGRQMEHWLGRMRGE